MDVSPSCRTRLASHHIQQGHQHLARDYTQDAGLLPAVHFYRRTSAHYRTILLQAASFGKLFRAKEHYKTLYFARFLEACFDTTKSDLYARAKAYVPVCPYPSFSRM